MESKEATVMGQRVKLMNQRAMYAMLLDKFHVTPGEVALLTDRQIYDYYFHPRDKHGAIKIPEAEITVPKIKGYEDELIALKSLFDGRFINAKDFERLREELGAKYGKE